MRPQGFFLSSEVHIADVWLCDSGAASPMSGDRSAFRSPTVNRRRQMERLSTLKGLGFYPQTLSVVHLSDWLQTSVLRKIKERLVWDSNPGLAQKDVRCRSATQPEGVEILISNMIPVRSKLGDKDVRMRAR
jgi:hypothetical protein